MSINATSSSVSNTTSSAQVSSASNSESAKKSNDTSFKDEMNKVEKSKDDKTVDKASDKKASDKTDNKDTTSKQDDNKVDTQANNAELNINSDDNQTLETGIDYNKFGSLAMMDVNSRLSNDIKQMINTTGGASAVTALSDISAVKGSGMMSLDFTNSVSVTKSDAEFFVNLTQKNDVSMQNIASQAQAMVDSGANVKEVKQSSQISQTLLNAINTARETNQPLRIDFDQNVSVILRIGKDGAIAANFIPGDKAVEQYLKNNIEALKTTFNENDLPYSDLSYSNRGSKQQKENRRNKQ